MHSGDDAPEAAIEGEVPAAHLARVRLAVVPLTENTPPVLVRPPPSMVNQSMV